MKNNFITKIIGATLAFAMMIGGAVGINAAEEAKRVGADAEPIADYTSITAGDYYIGATTSNKDYYLHVNDASASNSIAGTAVTDTENATLFTFAAGSSANKWTIKFKNSNYYLGLSTSKDNGKVQVLSSAQEFTASNKSSLIKLSPGGNSVLSKNSSGTQFGNYQDTQPGVWLLPVGSSGGGDTPTTYSVTYHDNNKTSGTVPTDNTVYETEDTVTVAGNTGNLARTGYTWSGWSVNQDGSGTAYGPAPYTTTYTVASANVNFYPIWVKDVTPLPESGTITINSTNSDMGAYGTDVAYTVPEDNTPGSEFGFSCTNVMKASSPNTGKLQFKKGSGVLYSTTPLSYIRSVTVNGANPSEYTITYGTSADAGCTSDTVGTENTFFKIANGNTVTGYWTVTIVYSLEAPALLTGLSIEGGLDAVRKTYDDGDTFDPSGLVINAEWNNVLDTENNVVDDVVWEPAVLTGGTTEVTGTYTFGSDSKTVTVTGLTVNVPVVIDGNSNKPANVPESTNTNVGEGQINASGVNYVYRALQTYSSNLEFNKDEANAYIGNNDSYGKFIKKIRLTLTAVANFGRLKMYKGNEPIPAENEVSTTTNTGLTRIYDFNNDSEYFTLKQSETGTWVQIAKIEVFLGDNAPTINTVSASINSGTYYATTTLSALDFNVTVTWTLGKADTHPTEGFTWTVNGNVNGTLIEGNNTIVVTYKGVSSDPFVISAAPARAKDVIESTLSTQALLKYHYSKGTSAVSDELTNALFGVSGSNYEEWNNKASNSDAVYAGKTSGGNQGTIVQLRTSGNEGIVTTASGGKAKTVTVEWNASSTDGKVLDIYGKNTAYSSHADLYNNSTRGIKLGSITSGTNTSITIDGDYSFIGIRSNSGALYLDSITIEWDATTYSFTNAAIKFGASISKTLWNDLNEQSTIVGYGVMLAKPSDLEGDFEIKDKYNSARNSAADIDSSFTDVAEKPYSLINNTAIKNYYNSISTSPVEDGDNYIWYLAKSVTGTDIGLTKSFTAVAYIRTVNDEIIFLDEITKSAAQIAKDDIDADPNDELDNEYLEGSLGYLAGLVA